MQDINEIHQIWDRLAEFPASQSNNEALQYLLESISGLISADHGFWLSVIRMDELEAELEESGGCTLGWRLGPVFYYKELPDDRSIYKSLMQKTESGEEEVSYNMLNYLRQAGSFRATFLRDHVSPEFFDSANYHNIFKSRNITDTLFVVAPVNADAKVCFCFNRIGSRASFEQRDLEITSYILRCLNWFHRQVLLSHGLLVADKALTPTEKKVMQHLLTELSEKQIAEKLQQKVDTTHKHVFNIYRKFSVNSRAALMAIWLGH